MNTHACKHAPLYTQVGREALAISGPEDDVHALPHDLRCRALPSASTNAQPWTRLRLTDAEPQIAEYGDYSDYQLLGSATFLIVGVGRFILVYTPCDGGGVAHVGTTDTSHASVRALCWARDLGEGAFASCAESGAVQVWRADTSAGCTGTLALTLPLGERAQEELATIAVVERYIAVSYEHTKALAVFDHGGTRLHVLEEAEDPDDFKDSEGGDFIFNRALVAQGDVPRMSARERAHTLACVQVKSWQHLLSAVLRCACGACGVASCSIGSTTGSRHAP